MIKKRILQFVVIGVFLGMSPEVLLAASPQKMCADAFSACTLAKDPSTKCNAFQNLVSTGGQSPTPMAACQAADCSAGYHMCQ